jgi:hypothetical protein
MTLLRSPSSLLRHPAPVAVRHPKGLPLTLRRSEAQGKGFAFFGFGERGKGREENLLFLVLIYFARRCEHEAIKIAIFASATRVVKGASLKV